MFFFTYLRRELRRRMRQAVFIALGLVFGIVLVIGEFAQCDRLLRCAQAHRCSRGVACLRTRPAWNRHGTESEGTSRTRGLAAPAATLDAVARLDVRDGAREINALIDT